MRALKSLAYWLLIAAIAPSVAASEAHPRLLLTAGDVQSIRQAEALPPSFADAIKSAQAKTDGFLAEIPDVPLPKDAGGGYTHEQHKRNSVTIYNAGMLYQLTGEVAYANLARDVLLAYAGMYADLPEHPKKKEQTPGKLFWQSLNESVWLLTSIQGYDAIYTALAKNERQAIEDGLLLPMANFLSEGQPQTFDKVHNHGTWAVSAVGMTGFVLDQPELVEKALFGLQQDGSAGFMKMLDDLFSPDGYYSEGPYYQRYALMPFMVFAKSIQQNQPERKIFEYRDGILLKAVQTTIQLSYADFFFPINDAIKDKGLNTIELAYGSSIAYGLNADPGLLSIVELQNQVVLTGDGFRAAKALDAGLARPYDFKSLQLRDGPGGDRGALSILRNGQGPDHQAVVFKATSQGMGHGHFDKLSWLLYDNGHEVVTDYGAARFLNVEEKFGGHYLPENDSWAKQTIAHNTLVVDETSHFGGDWKLGEKYHPVPMAFATSPNIDVTAAKMSEAYPGVVFARSMAVLKDEIFPEPVVLDVVKVLSEKNHQYDLPLYFQGHITYLSHSLQANTKSLPVLGKQNGYQHLWLRATASVKPGELFKVTWLQANRFYTWSVLADAPMEVMFIETGATDPDFNLRHEQGLVLRVKGTSNHSFVSLLEPHGEYNGSREFTTASASNIESLSRTDSGLPDVIRVVTKNAKVRSVAFSYDADPNKQHSVETLNGPYTWTGYYQLFED